MDPMKLLLAVLPVLPLLAQSWVMQTSNTTASLRGISAVSDQVVWASGTGGTFLRTTDGGATWTASKVPGAETLDFRGIRAIDARTAYLMSIGPGDKSRIYKTTDAGEHWSLQFSHPDPKGFLDSIAFWDANRGIVVGDALEGSADIRTTDDGGQHWQRQKTPPAILNEGSFAASNTCLFLGATGRAWFITGGVAAARVFRSEDWGRTWAAATTPVRNDSASAGIFSIAFQDQLHGVTVGGDYSKDKEDRQNIAVTADSGRTWTAPPSGPAGFHSAVVWVPELKLWIATGTSGSDTAAAANGPWTRFDEGSFNSLSFAPGGAGWAAGARGRIARFRPQ
jgi:photosystem II stability/assembly factor-like uncharacterized protein